MLFQRYGTFTGGIDLPDEKQATLDLPIAPIARPERLRVSLSPCGGRAGEVLVEAGQRVQAGQRLARAASPSGVDVFAPLSGRVASTVTVKIAFGDEFAAVPAVELDRLSDPPNVEVLPRQEGDFRDLSSQELRERLAEGHLVMGRRPPCSLSGWIERARRHDCHTLIANVMENQPMVTADHRLLVEHGEDVVRGLAILGRAVEARELVLAVDQRRVSQYRRLLSASRQHDVSRIALSHKYPTGADAILVKILTRRETPPGQSTLAVRAGVVDAATCLAACHWVLGGRRQLGRVLTLSGPGIRRPGNYYVPFGAPCFELAEGWTKTLVHGGPMTGLLTPQEAVVSPATEALLALDTPVGAVPRPCIRCGWCTDHCPARLNVAQLNDEYELNLVNSARKAGVMACVECGICSYVCPAGLPLTSRVKQLKRTIRLIRSRLPLLAGMVS